MKIEYSPEEVIATPTEAIALWGARIDRMNYALQHNHKVTTGGWSNDGMLLWDLGERHLKGEDFRSHPYYEDAILYELKPELTYWSVIEFPGRQLEPDVNRDKKGLAAEFVGRAALNDGLRRLSLWVPYAEETLTYVPAAAVAALCINRADINEPIDRKLFDRKEEIEIATDALLARVPVRHIEAYAMKPGGVREPISVPVYIHAPRFNPEQTARYGLDPDSSLNPWWQELNNDLAKIDAVAVAGHVA